MLTRPILLLGAALLLTTTVYLSAQAPPLKPPPAPTIYLVIEAATCEPNAIKIFGASNLPPRAVILLIISDFDGDAWKDYTDPAYLSLAEGGLFQETLHPKRGLKFHGNLLAQSYFSPVYVPPKTSQPESVLEVVGKKGENLGGLNNPQVGQLSGPNYYLTAIARVPNCGER
jgi:hypothetical protein